MKIEIYFKGENIIALSQKLIRDPGSEWLKSKN